MPRCRRKQNEDDLAAHDLKIAEGKEKFGDVEVFERQRDRAEYLVKIGDAAGAQAAFASISAGAKLSTGQKIDVAISQTRLALAHADWPAVKEKLALAKECVAGGVPSPIPKRGCTLAPTPCPSLRAG